MNEVRAGVEETLASLFERERADAAAHGESAVSLIDTIADLTMRPAKRVRPTILAAANVAITGELTLTPPLRAAMASFELFQTYLLIHDDWMDGDDMRRGGASVHAAFARSHREDPRLAASLTIIAGNLASALAWDLARRTSRSKVLDHFALIHRQVVFGQQLDLLSSHEVSRMQNLKTGSYTARGPLAIGAALADATDEQQAALHEYGRPLGEAFQIRDDLLGVFGDADRIGKPTGTDLRTGKQTSLTHAAHALASASDRAAIIAAVGDPSKLDEAKAALVRCGARAEVERRLGGLLDRSRAALEGAPLSERGVEMLNELAALLGARDR